jgi:excinuclease ABC subunit A
MSDIGNLLAMLDKLVEAGNTVIVIEHELRVVAQSDWVVDVGPGAGDRGGRIVAEGPPRAIARAKGSRTAAYLKPFVDAA